MKLPTDAPRNQTPIISDETRCGASFVVALRPTGDSVSSPSVWKRYVSTSHHGDAWPPSAETSPAPTIVTKPRPSSTRPIPNLVAVDGSRPLRPRYTQIIATNGAMVKMKKAFSDWNQAAGTMVPFSNPGIHWSQSPRVRSVDCSANRLRLEPACSKAARKMA